MIYPKQKSMDPKNKIKHSLVTNMRLQHEEQMNFLNCFNKKTRPQLKWVGFNIKNLLSERIDISCYS